VRDPAEKNQPGIGQGRDPERSPMLWLNLENAGFTSSGVPTWLPLVWNWPSYTVETENADPGTMLKLYRRLLRLRRERSALHGGLIAEVSAEEGVLRYIRREGAEKIQVLLNMTDQERTVETLPGRILLSSMLDREDWVEGEVRLRRDEAMVIDISPVP
jgi:alpha-glucosidase